jgi:hypothetical protein
MCHRPAQAPWAHGGGWIWTRFRGMRARRCYAAGTSLEGAQCGQDLRRGRRAALSAAVRLWRSRRPSRARRRARAGGRGAAAAAAEARAAQDRCLHRLHFAHVHPEQLLPCAPAARHARAHRGAHGRGVGAMAGALRRGRAGAPARWPRFLGRHFPAPRRPRVSVRRPRVRAVRAFGRAGGALPTAPADWRPLDATAPRASPPPLSPAPPLPLPLPPSAARGCRAASWPHGASERADRASGRAQLAPP